MSDCQSFQYKSQWDQSLSETVFLTRFFFIRLIVFYIFKHGVWVKFFNLGISFLLYLKIRWTKQLHIHCNPLQGNYRVELLHKEIPVIMAGNEFAEYNFLLFWLHFSPCFNNIEIIALVPVMCTGNCKVILQGLKGCFDTL